MDFLKLSCKEAIVPLTDGVIIASNLKTLFLKGADARLLLERLVPLLNGTKNKEEIFQAFPRNLSPLLKECLGLLERMGLLIHEDKDNNQDTNVLSNRLLRALSPESKKGLNPLLDARILVIGLEPWGAIAASELDRFPVGELHVWDDRSIDPDDILTTPLWDHQQLEQRRTDAFMSIIRCNKRKLQHGRSVSYSKKSLSELLNRPWDLIIGGIHHTDLTLRMQVMKQAHRFNIPYLFGSVHGLELFVGPLVVPGTTACWNCCRLRLLANGQDPDVLYALESALMSEGTSIRAPFVGLSQMVVILGHLMVLESIRFLLGYEGTKYRGDLLIHNMLTFQATRHPVIPMPWCGICGGAEVATLSGNRKSFKELSNTEELLSELSEWIDSRTGVILNVGLRKREANELPSIANALLSAYTDGSNQPRVEERVGGKGLSERDAIIGALGEAVERYSASRYKVGELRYSNLCGLDGDVLDPRSLSLYQEAQYVRHEFPFCRFDPQQAYHWKLGHWLDTKAAVWVPAAMTYLSGEKEEHEIYCQSTSNGLAAGANYQDAALRATFELVERDAFMLTWLGQLPAKRLDLDNTLDPRICIIIDALERFGATIELYLLEVGLSIPVVICLGIGNGTEWPGATVTAAAHLSPRIAIEKAVLEQCYSGLSIRNLMHTGKCSIPERAEDVTRFADHALYYVPEQRQYILDFLRYPNRYLSLCDIPEPPDLTLDACIKRLSDNGVRVAVVDVTPPDVDKFGHFKVVRALGTDMQPIHCGHGLERLGNPRLWKLLKDDELNPHPHPFC